MVGYAGRAFLHSMRRARYKDEARQARAVSDPVYLNQAFRLDVQWWFDNLRKLNGFISLVDMDATCDIRIDATGHDGIGVFCDGGFVSISASEVRHHELAQDHSALESSTDWELFGFLVLIRAFGSYLGGKRVMIRNDNENAVRAVK